MTKIKHTPIPRKDCIMISPLSVTTCVNEIKAMAHYELEVRVVRQSAHSAELEVVERYNDDVPLYITYRLQQTSDGTCVAYQLSSLILQKPQPRSYARKKYDPTAQRLAGIVVAGFALIFALDLSVEIFMLHLFIISPMLLLPAMLMTADANSNYGQPEVTSKQEAKIVQRMTKRAEAVRSEVIQVLRDASKNVRYDELGNAYYLDVGDKNKRADP